MTDKKTEFPITPRDFLSQARDLLGDTWTVKLFCCGLRNLDRWTARRPYVSEESVRENPIEKYERLLERVAKEPGGLSIARASVDRLAAIVGCDLACDGRKEADRQTIEAECLDDYPALTAFHEAIRAGSPAPYVRMLKRDAIEEIEETATVYFEKGREEK